MITVKFIENSDYAILVENWLVDYENENGVGISRTHVTEPFNGMGIYAQDGNVLIGGLTFRVQNDWIFLCCGYVLPEYRGQGIYSKFIYELEHMAVKQNLCGIFVSTYTFEAPHIYEHLGFTKGAVLEDLPKGNTNIDYYKRIAYGHKPKVSQKSGTSHGSGIKLCAEQECAPRFGDKDDCEFYQHGKCTGAELKYYNTIAVDFDGTLCEYRFPDIGKPKPLVIAFVKQHAARGTKIILHTCRENGTRRALLDEAVEFCKAHGIPLYAVNENPENTYPEQYGITTTGRKVYADLYIDDKAISTADIESDM